VALARRSLGIQRIGHTGTLDPMASGVLPLVIGRATRLARFFAQSDKEYEADIRLGVQSDTYDAAGEIIAAAFTRDLSTLTARDLDEAIAAFRGTYAQKPPPFSAKKIGGTRAYHLARRREPVDLASVEVTVHELQLHSWHDDRLRVRIVCSSGFYVRSLAHALGQSLGTGALLERLVRRRSGEFDLARAVSLDALAHTRQELLSRVIPPAELLPGLPSVVLTSEGAVHASHGRPIGPAHIARSVAPAAAYVRLLDPGGRLVALAKPKHESQIGGAVLLHPGIVLE
jgi:tRNA pseudouridine55 synthase